MQINAWRVQLHELSQSEHTHVSTMQPGTSWTIGASKEVTFTCSGQKPKVTFHSFILLMPYTSKHQQVLSALPPKYTQNSTCSHHLQGQPLPYCKPPLFPTWTLIVVSRLFSHSTLAPRSLFSTQLLEGSF